MRLALAGAALDSLDATGLLRIDPVTIAGVDSVITPARATQLVAAYLRRRPFNLDVWSRGEVHVTLPSSALTPCAPTRLFPSAYVTLGDTASFATRWTFGPWYWVPLCDERGRRRGRTGVAALATTAGLTDSALTARLDRYAGIVSEGMIAGLDQLATAEDAAVAAWQLTGVRVTQVPTPWPRSDGWIWLSSWEVTLERAITITDAGAGDARTVTRVIVGNNFEGGATLYRADTGAYYPATLRISNLPVAQNDSVRMFDLPLVPGARRRLIAVTVTR
ncbi:MAG: hypothetical protein HY275_00480 [Gemmatimonadetes bacterium]|nr:hypothetical protein [Gemmatimonadota bacterium]